MKNKVYSFSVEDANNYGIDSAIILHNMRYWLDYARAHGEMEKDGYYWMFASASRMVEVFPFWTSNKIQKLLKSLEENGVIIAGCYNKSKFDRTKWYTMEEYSIQPNGGMGISETADCTFSETADSLYDQYKDNNNNISLVPSETKRSKFKYDDKDLQVAIWMWKRVQIINPTAKKPNQESWANTVRLMREIDNRAHTEITGLFDWANKDSFWCSNILSPEKLRKQWDKLTVKRGSNEGHQQPKTVCGESTDGMSTARKQMLAARAQRDSNQASRSSMGCNGGAVYDQVDGEEWSDSKQVMAKGDSKPF